MRRSAPDVVLYLLVVALMAIGIANLYSIEGFPPFSWKYAYVRQLVWAGVALGIMGLSSVVEGGSWRFFTYFLYGGSAVLMLLTAVVAREVNGARAWLDIGPFRFQPSEFMKVATSLAVAAFVTRYEFRWERLLDRVGVALLILLPVGLTLLQKDTGTALTYAAFLVPLYRWGLSGWVIGLPLSLGTLAFLTLLYNWVKIGLLLTGLGILSYVGVFRRKYLWGHVAILGGLWIWLALSGILYQKVLAPHQRQRIESLLDPYKDPRGAGWNSIQARIAITAGGAFGRGYGKGLQSKLDFIPQRHTDFAFCGVAEEWGWIGSTATLLLFAFFLLRLTTIAEKSNSLFALLYGYALSGFLWIHLLINVAMMVGLFPIVGIPLVFISYGGSAWVAVAWGIGILQSLYRERSLRLFG